MRRLLLVIAVCWSTGFALVAWSALPVYVIRNKGSDTMYRVAVAWAEAYQKRNQNLKIPNQETPGGELRGNYISYEKLEVKATGGGSGNGLAALINGHADIANASRAVKERELGLAARMGRNVPQGHVVGWDAVLVLVHEDNPLVGAQLGQLGDIFDRTGKITHWNHMGVTVPGCVDNKIKLVSRKNNSGTYSFFKDRIASEGIQFHPGMASLEYSREVVNHTANTPCAISYAGMAYVTGGVKVLCVSDGEGGECVYPSVQSVADGRYSLARPLYMYTLGEPTGLVRDYLDWVRSDEGQEILKQGGYVPLREGPPLE